MLSVTSNGVTLPTSSRNSARIVLVPSPLVKVKLFGLVAGNAVKADGAAVSAMAHSLAPVARPATGAVVMLLRERKVARFTYALPLSMVTDTPVGGVVSSVRLSAAKD